MKHYIVESRFVRPITEFREAVAEHRTYLQRRYDEGVMLFSGPKASRDGEVLVIRAESDEWIKEFIKDEPYHRLGFAEYTFTCFMPTMKNSMVEGWV